MNFDEWVLILDIRACRFMNKISISIYSLMRPGLLDLSKQSLSSLLPIELFGLLSFLVLTFGESKFLLAW